MLSGIKPDQSGFVWLHRFTDAVLPLALLSAIVHLSPAPWHDRYLVMGILGSLFFVFSAQTVGIYQNWRARPLFSSAKLILNAWLLTWASLIIIAFLTKDANNFSRLAVSIWAVVTLLGLISYRILIRILLGKLRSSGKNGRTIAIIGAGNIGKRIASIINDNSWLGYEVSAFYDDNPELHNSDINNIPVMGCTHNIADNVNLNKYNEIYICLPLRAESKIKQILDELTDTTAIVKFVPDVFTFDLMHAKWTELKGIPIVSVFDTPLNSNSARFLKRIEDIALSLLILILISPIMFIVILGIKITSPGPIFYRQTRVGWNGKNFEMFKFRSMPIDTEKSGIQWGSAKSKTNTKFGQFIRATSLDELPQFLNVLKGDMSIVGPRPERDIFVKQFRKEIPRYMQKHMVKAGITGWAQIHGWRGDTSLEKRIEYDLHYINAWSVWLDIKIIILTVFKGFINKNAC
ncbi:undecaprenyl-phosphate glucose phosphotransferase [Thiomicrorhabdus arctica]|uniref:undecaprenyl-phosphate glucose phosphotransferase n=1 Tax=Thiomicrorhabdus arctica TaxID=131540 RepID=UPI00035D4AC0|nr:undecaprenyl-phosphate glucose phosphotransferase [Thiomicrorhabdus arctica]